MTSDPTPPANHAPTDLDIYNRLGELSGKMDGVLAYMIANDRRQEKLAERVLSLEVSRGRLRGGLAVALSVGPVIGAAMWEWLRKKFGF